MNITIMGGGKLGIDIAKKMSKIEKVGITLIEKDHEKCVEIADEINATVINGDVSNPNFLSSAGIEDTDIFIIATGIDEINFVCADIITKLFNYEKIIARVNNPKNREIFEKIGVAFIASSTEIMSDYIVGDIERLFIERSETNE